MHVDELNPRDGKPRRYCEVVAGCGRLAVSQSCPPHAKYHPQGLVHNPTNMANYPVAACPLHA